MEEHIVCYLDILGYKGLVNKYGSDAEKATELMEAFENIDSFLKQQLEIKDEILHRVFEKVQLIILSDSILITIPISRYSNELNGVPKEFDELLAYYYYLFFVRYVYIQVIIKTGHFCRGAIVKGAHFDKKFQDGSGNRFIFSPALINAYQLQDKAVYPRIIFDDSIYKLITDLYDLIDKEYRKGVSDTIRHRMPFIDHTGIRCFDIFFDLPNREQYMSKGKDLLDWLSIMKTKIYDQLDENRVKPEIIEKYIYLINYFNNKVQLCNLDSNLLIQLNKLQF